MQKSVRVTIPNTAAGATSQFNSGNTDAPKFSTNGDDDKPRRLIGLRVSTYTALVDIDVRRAGSVMQQVELGGAAAADGLIPLDIPYPANVKFEAVINNNSAGAYNGNFAEFIYTVADS